MALPGTVVAAAPGLHGVDAAASISSSAAKKVKAAGFSFCLRYLTSSSPQKSGDLSVSEANGILSAGLALMPVQHVDLPGWRPTAAMGAAKGAAAAANATTLGFPGGVNVWVDLEGIATATAAEDVIAYCNSWFAELDNAGYVGGVYVGANAILNGDQLFFRLKTKHYWKSGSTVPDIPHRGYQMVQRIVAKDIVAGIEVDRNLTMTDLMGATVLWLAP